eukprot:TRINITY_DN16674_c0_g1_i1.p1 TRINITY_DN16674_c0_g1~~TRINITY_DN16674_c0_g1_i1.p1  ORF type:complete len:176 (+),score=8.86 TRINITY_DN16674_c0_g1_i1:163-690(+)
MDRQRTTLGRGVFHAQLRQRQVQRLHEDSLQQNERCATSLDHSRVADRSAPQSESAFSSYRAESPDAFYPHDGGLAFDLALELERQFSTDSLSDLMQGSSENFTATQDLSTLQHDRGLCKPCIYNLRPSGCLNGSSCAYCHLCNEADAKRYKQRMRKQKIAANRLSRGEVVQWLW